MDREERKNEIIASMKSFSKEAYHKSEILPELLLLQKELVEVVFDEDHAANGDLKIWDVEAHLKQMSISNGNAGADELERFEIECKEICNRIKAEISGNWGENKTFQRLEEMNRQGKVIRNIELTTTDNRTELDGVVVTSKAIFVIEVKNSKKNIFIDETGNYYRTGNYMRLDCNIGEKMRNKVSLLKDVLSDLGLKDIKVEGLLVFTNNRMEVSNHFDAINTCFLGQLPYIIEDYKGIDIYSNEDIELLARRIEESKCKELYAYDYDIEQFKQSFAELVSLIEEASIKKEAITEKGEEVKHKSIVSEQVTEDTSLNNTKEKKQVLLEMGKSIVSYGGWGLAAGLAIAVFLKKNK